MHGSFRWTSGLSRGRRRARWPTRTRWDRAAILALAAVVGCLPAMTPEERPEVLGPALAEITADGIVTQEEHAGRNQYNVCPDVRPAVGTDANGVTWSPDLVCGLLPNPLHWPLDCYRGRSPELGLSCYQCCYAGDQLVPEGPLAGTFDYVCPYGSPLALLWHYLLDVLAPA